ncbi:MAG: hypothetical protein COB15_05995 [Flavobacteriales bacterium]|nr:MAG: hypothetical protein COB15_05995 [Flavobacteriales bacterium]
MIRKDYIQRYFDELAKVLAAVLQLKNDLKPVEAESKLNDFSIDYLGISFEKILAIKNNLIGYLIKENNFTLDHFKILEDLLYHKHLLNPNDNHLKKITLEVLNHLTENDSDYSLERNNRIKQIIDDNYIENTKN